MLSDLDSIGARAAVVIVALAALIVFLGMSVAAGRPPRPHRRGPVAVTAAGSAEPRVVRPHPQPPLRHHPVATDETTIGPDGLPQSAHDRPAERRVHRSVRPAPAAVPRSSTSLVRAVGAKIMTPMIGTYPTAEMLRRVRDGAVGGVILFGDNVRSIPQVHRLTSALQDAAAAGGNPPLLIATDQEGGIVKRLAGAPPTLSAAQMGQAGALSASRQGAGAGAALRGAGVNVDLAPVADVTAFRSNFLGSRAFGSQPARVASAACAFAGGLQSSGVAATLKHFPGLGAATGNTDGQAVTVGSSAAALRADYSAYRACGRRTELVMVSNASYPALDGTGRPAVLSPTIIGHELRGLLGFHGVVISDAFGAPGPSRYPHAAVKAVNAGVDMMLWGPGQGARALAAYQDMLAAARAGSLHRRALEASAGRIRRLREAMG